MASSQPDQQQSPVAAGVVAGTLIGAGGLLAVDRIRLLYLAAETRALQALRKAVSRVLRAKPDDVTARFDSKWRLDREVVGVVNQLVAVGPAEIQAVVESARDAGIQAAEHDLGSRTDVLPHAGDQPIPDVTIDHNRIVSVVDETYRRIIDKAVAAETGRINRQRVAQRALDEFAARGISVFTDKAGRQWSIDAYAEMAVRTVAAWAQRDAYMKRATTAGVTKFRISHSPTCCPLCAPYDGQIVTVEELAEAYTAGLGHPNCRHQIVAFRASDKIVPAPKPDMNLYEATQRLRYLERRVREARRREAVALDPAALRKARSELRAAWAAIRDHIDTNDDLVRQRNREQIIRARG